MNEKEKYKAEIETKLTSFNKTLNEIKAKQELRERNRINMDIGSTIRKRDEMQIKMKALEQADSNSWEPIKAEVDSLMTDIDKELRTALAYFS